MVCISNFSFFFLNGILTILGDSRMSTLFPNHSPKVVLIFQLNYIEYDRSLRLLDNLVTFYLSYLIIIEIDNVYSISKAKCMRGVCGCEIWVYMANFAYKTSLFDCRYSKEKMKTTVLGFIYFRITDEQ